MALDDPLSDLRARALNEPLVWIRTELDATITHTQFVSGVNSKEGFWSPTPDGFFDARRASRSGSGKHASEVRFVPFSSRPDLLGAVADELDRIPDNRRELLVRWLTHCFDRNIDEMEHAYLLDAKTTREEVEIFLSPFDRADEIMERLTQTRSRAADSADDLTLIAALQNRVGEMVANANSLGEAELANDARSVTEFRIVDKIRSRPNFHPLDSDIAAAISEAARSQAFADDDPLISNFYSIVSEWFSFSSEMAVHIAQPVLDLDTRLDSFFQVYVLGAASRVTVDQAVIARFEDRRPVEPWAAAIGKSSEENAADRVGVDWSDLPTDPQRIDELIAHAEAGHYPSLAKLSLMYLGGHGLDYDLAQASMLLEQAAGDYHSVVDCYETNSQNGLAAADYCLYRLHSQGWGYPKSDAMALQYLRKAAEGGLPVAVKLLGMRDPSR